jgi:hypothetical protein
MESSNLIGSVSAGKRSSTGRIFETPLNTKKKQKNAISVSTAGRVGQSARSKQSNEAVAKVDLQCIFDEVGNETEQPMFLMDFPSSDDSDVVLFEPPLSIDVSLNSPEPRPFLEEEVIPSPSGHHQASVERNHEILDPADSVDATSTASHDLTMAQTEIPLFPIEKPGNDTMLYVEPDLDSISLIGGDLSQMAFRMSIDTFEFCNTFNSYLDRTTSSRLSIATDSDYNPVIVNKHLKKVGLELLKNIRICKAAVKSVEFTFSLCILQRNKVSNPFFSERYLGVICLAMNMAHMHTDLLQQLFTDDIYWTNSRASAYVTGLRGMEPFSFFY